MLKVVYIYDVSKEKQGEYLKVTAEMIKPFWESHGCDAYTLWVPMEGSTRFMKEMVFKDEETMQSTLKVTEAEPIKKLFSELATDITRTTYRQIL